MKLRIHGNKVRLRLNRNEVTQLAESGVVEEKVDFQPGVFLRYGIEATIGQEQVAMTFDDDEILVAIPAGLAREWATSDMVSIEGERILIEKDFQCLHREPGEEDVDTFPNPAAQQ